MTTFIGKTNISPNSTVNIVTADTLSGFIIGNESGYTIVVNVAGTGFTKTLYPGTVDYFPAGKGYSGTLKLQSFSYLNNIASFPGSFVLIDAVLTGEDLSQYTFPFSLNRASNIGNTINTFVATSTISDTLLVNDGNAANTQIIEATIGGGASIVSVTNDGKWVQGNATYAGRLSVDNGQILTDGGGNLTTNNLEIVGNITTANLIIKGGGTAVFNNGTKTPIIAAFKVFQFTSNGTNNQTITHGMGIAPIMVLVTNYQNTPGTSVPGLVSFDSATATFDSVGMANSTYLCCAIG